MNALLWVFQILLAFWNLTGGFYSFKNHETLKSSWANNLPNMAWMVICGLQILFAIGVVIPKLSPIAAAYLALNSLLGLVLFSAYAGFPGMIWGILPALLAAFVAYGRMKLMRP